MVTFVDLRDARLTPLAEAAHAWSVLARQLRSLEDRAVGDLIGPLRRSGWRGAAAGAALSVLDTYDDEFELAGLRARNLSIVLRSAHSRLVALQTRLLDRVADAAGYGLWVRDDGSVNLPPADVADRHDPDGVAARSRLVRYAAECEAELTGIVGEATRADAELSMALRRFGPDDGGNSAPWEWGTVVDDTRRVAGLFDVSEGAIPAGAGPRRNADWWAGLTEDQRTLYRTAYPDRIGALDGLPAAVRDEANQLALRDHYGDLINNRSTWQRDIDRSASLLARLEAAEYDAPRRRLLLLGIDNTADGRAIVSVGDPDLARHTAVVVPGITNTLDNIGDDVAVAYDLQTAADQLTYGTDGDVAVVAWLGYDTPGLDLSAVRGEHARAGAPLLDGFVDGLRVAHDGERGHLTVIGHSYGSTVVGEAAGHGEGLAADDLVVVGSPGTHVRDADELNIDPRHVWAGAARGDDVSGWMSHFAHGPEPHRDGFGANRFTVDTTGHEGYWDPDSQSLLNQANIVTGRYGLVGLDHGQRPPDWAG